MTNKKLLVIIPARGGSKRLRNKNILKIRKELGWSPRVDLKQGLQETIVGYKNARL